MTTRLSPLVFVLLDGLSWRVACQTMGHLLALCERGEAQLCEVRAALPTLSRPLYECLLTGVEPCASGILHNGVVRLSTQSSLFHLVREAGGTTAAAAYHWVSELYNRAPYDAVRDRFTDDPVLPIQHGIFYAHDTYPDDHLLIDAETLRHRHAPDFLFVHPMGIDDAGHRHGGASAGYHDAARALSVELSRWLPVWRAAGYRVLATSDHGMSVEGSHGGPHYDERRVPLFLLGARLATPDEEAPLAQTEIFHLARAMLGLRTSAPIGGRDLELC